MDFIEQVFGLAPDDGSGTLEMLLLYALALVVTAPLMIFIGNRLSRKHIDLLS